jgi:hypothetical protein
MRWAGHVARIGENGNACWLLVRKPEGKRPIGRTSLSWVDNMKMDLGDIVWSGMDWITIRSNVGLFEHGNETLSLRGAS